MITEDEFLATAELAYLPVEEAELTQLFPAFKESLDFIAVIQTFSKAEDSERVTNFLLGTIAGKVDSTRIRPDTAPLNPARASTDPASDQQNKTLLNYAGEQDGNFIAVPNIL